MSIEKRVAWLEAALAASASHGAAADFSRQLEAIGSDPERRAAGIQLARFVERLPAGMTDAEIAAAVEAEEPLADAARVLGNVSPSA